MKKSFLSARHHIVKYGVALLLPLLVSGIVFPLDQTIRERCYCPLFIAAIVISAWSGGMWPGLLASLVSVLVIDYFIWEPGSLELAPAQAIHLGSFLLTAILISSLNARRQRLTEAMHRKKQQLDAARIIQQTFYPPSPPVLTDFEIAGAAQPADATGGDYFDYRAMRNGSWGIAIGDVSGHGFGPALLMAEIRAYFHALVLTHDDPGAILTLINQLLCQDGLEERFITFFLGCLDPSRHTLLYASAGHEGYLVSPTGQVSRLAATACPLGVLKEEVIPCASSIPLEPGQILFLVTDGIVEASSSCGDLFGSDQMMKTVLENRGKNGHEIIAALFETVRGFSGGAPQHDDQTVVIIKRLEGLDPVLTTNRLGRADHADTGGLAQRRSIRARRS